jgi:hypothetical protein
MNQADLESTIISQYANSPRLMAIIQNMNADIDPSVNFDDFYANIWNINTAVGYGLDIWGRIIGVTRNLSINGALTTLSDADFRTLLFVKALANITDCSAHSLNQLLSKLFAAQGKCYATDVGHMQMLFMFEFNLTAIDLAILTQAAVLPHPAGVGAGVMSFDASTIFGFSGSGLQPFNQGTFFSGVTHVA